MSRAELEDKLRVPNARRLWFLGDAYRRGLTSAEIFELTKIDPWFLENVRRIIAEEHAIATRPGLDAETLRRWKRMGFSDRRIARLRGEKEHSIRARRIELGVRAVYKTVDTCGAEFAAFTPYLYSTYEGEDESALLGSKGKRKARAVGGDDR